MTHSKRIKPSSSAKRYFMIRAITLSVRPAALHLMQLCWSFLVCGFHLAKPGNVCYIHADLWNVFAIRTKHIEAHYQDRRLWTSCNECACMVALHVNRMERQSSLSHNLLFWRYQYSITDTIIDRRRHREKYCKNSFKQ